MARNVWPLAGFIAGFAEVICGFFGFYAIVHVLRADDEKELHAV